MKTIMRMTEASMNQSGMSVERSRIASLGIPSLCRWLVTGVMLLAISVVGAPGEPSGDPAGFYRIDCLGNSDTVVSIPFGRPAAAHVVVESVVANMVTFKGTPGWTTDQFVYSSVAEPPQTNTYYIRFLSGAKEGRYFPVAGNGTNSVVLNLDGDDISAVTDGDLAAVIPYWTLATAFPESNGIFASPSMLNRPTEILLPDLQGAGINLSASKIYFFHAGIWKQVGQGNVSRNDDILLPDAYVIVRHNVATNTVCTFMGEVLTSKIAIPLAVSADSKQDNFVSLARPTTLSLNESGLIDTGAFKVSESALNRQDELLVFNNAVAARNKSVSAIYYYLLNSGWRKVGSPDIVGDDLVFAPGAAVIIRKSTSSVVPVWINSAPY